MLKHLLLIPDTSDVRIPRRKGNIEQLIWRASDTVTKQERASRLSMH